MSTFIDALRDAQIGVLSDHRRHLPETYLSAGQRLVVPPAERNEVGDREGYLSIADGQAHRVRALRVQHRRQRIGTLRDQVEAVALAQVASVQAALGRPHATKYETW